MKTSTQYVCQNCGSISSKWMGKCSKCESWNSYMEEIIKEKREKKEVWKKNNLEKNIPINLDKISNEERKRIVTSDKELNRVLGGGIVPGSVILIGGEPGIGKSTLMLQFVLALKSLKTLYVSGEESKEQIKIRSERVGGKNQNCFIYTETNLESLFLASQNLDPNILIIDSIQTLSTNNLESTPGSISQIKECTFELMKYCKENGKTVFLIGHITKDGIIAGPKILEHMVDVVVIFEGDKNLSYRLLRTKKNRYGPTNSLGIYEMAEKGLKEVSNPSDILISQKDNELSGVCIGNIVEGNRSLVLEIQSLVSTSNYSTSQRSCNGYNIKRFNMILAVLEKRLGLQLNSQDVFVNVAGGLKIDDPSGDLALCMAIISSYEEKVINNKLCFTGEVGLNGEIRPVSRIESRIMEAEKLGFKEIIIPFYNKVETKHKIKISPYRKIQQVYENIFKQ